MAGCLPAGALTASCAFGMLQAARASNFLLSMLVPSWVLPGVPTGAHWQVVAMTARSGFGICAMIMHNAFCLDMRLRLTRSHVPAVGKCCSAAVMIRQCACGMWKGAGAGVSLL